MRLCVLAPFLNAVVAAFCWYTADVLLYGKLYARTGSRCAAAVLYTDPVVGCRAVLRTTAGGKGVSLLAIAVFKK